jgi:hypothetical protein
MTMIILWKTMLQSLTRLTLFSLWFPYKLRIWATTRTTEPFMHAI